MQCSRNFVGPSDMSDRNCLGLINILTLLKDADGIANDVDPDQTNRL